MSRLFFVSIVVFAGCTDTGQKAPCTIEANVAADVTGRPWIDCSAFLTQGDGGVDDRKMLRARECALEAVRQNMGFALIYEVADATGALGAGFSGVPQANGRILVRQYASTEAPSPTVSVQTCNAEGTTAALGPTPGCVVTATRPCLQCNRPSGGRIRCGG